MRFPQRLLGFTLVGLILIGASPNASALQSGAVTAAQSGEPPIRFESEESLTIGDDPTQLLLVNNTPVVWEISATAAVYSADGDRTEVEVLGEQPATLRKLLALEIAAVPTKLANATGFVVITAHTDTRRVRISRPIAVGGATAEAVITKWSGTSDAFLREDLPRTVPLAGTCAAVEAGEVSVVSGGDIGTISYTCEGSADPALALDTSAIDRIGKYEGTLEIGGSTVSLTYLETRPVWWAVLCLLLGFLLAAWVQTYATNARPLNRAHNALNDLLRLAVANQEKFQEAAQGRGYANYTLLPAATREAARLQGEIADLRPSGWRRVAFFLPQPKASIDDGLKPIATKTSELAEVISGWPEAATKLEELRKSLAGLSGAQRALAPSLLAHAETLVAPAGGDLITVELTGIDDFRNLVDEVPLTTSTLELLARVLEIRQAIGQLPTKPSHSGDLSVGDHARQTYNLIVGELLAAENAQDVIEARVDRLIETARRDLLKIPQEATVRPAEASVGPATGVVAATSLLGGLFGRISHVAEQAYEGLARGTASGLLWLATALLVAVWTGLYALYVDKPWGTPADMVAAVVWGLVTTTVLTPLMAAIEAVMERPVPVGRKAV